MKKFKPFDRVLVKTHDNIWKPDLYSHISGTLHETMVRREIHDSKILPYEGNEHLLGTNNEPEEEITLKEGEKIVCADKLYTLLEGRGIISLFIKKNEDSIIDIDALCWSYCIPFSQFKERNTKHDILCVRNGKLIRYE